jgi:predicted GNAT family N-acyltransferase
MAIVFKTAESKFDLGRCISVRTVVFVVGQNVPIEYEADEREDTCRHILGLDDNKPCAAARWRVYKPHVAKIERVAVLDTYRGKGLGLSLMHAVMEDIKSAMPDCKTMRLEAQDYAIPFYERLGFAVVGDGFLDCNIPHHWMEKSLTN